MLSRGNPSDRLPSDQYQDFFICIFPESRDSSTEDHGLWLRDLLKIEIEEPGYDSVNYLDNKNRNAFDASYHVRSVCKISPSLRQ